MILNRLLKFHSSMYLKKPLRQNLDNTKGFSAGCLRLHYIGDLNADCYNCINSLNPLHTILSLKTYRQSNVVQFYPHRDSLP